MGVSEREQVGAFHDFAESFMPVLGSVFPVLAVRTPVEEDASGLTAACAAENHIVVSVFPPDFRISRIDRMTDFFIPDNRDNLLLVVPVVEMEAVFGNDHGLTGLELFRQRHMDVFRVVFQIADGGVIKI